MTAEKIEKKAVLLQKSLQQVIPFSLFGMFCPLFWVVMPPVSLVYIYRRRALLNGKAPSMRQAN